MKSIRYLLPLLLFLVACASDNWRTIRPMQERLITMELKTGYFQGANDIHINSYIIPDLNETPEVRLIVVGRFNANSKEDLDNLVREVEEVVVGVMPYASEIPRDTIRIRIQLTGYDSSKKVMEYSARKWRELDKTITDSELRNNAKWLQSKMAKQRGFE